VGDRTFFPQHAEGATLDEIVPAFLVQHYLERPTPPTIVAPGGRDDPVLAEVLSGHAGHNVQLVTKPGGGRRLWVTMAVQTAELATRQRLAPTPQQADRLAALQEALGLPQSVQR